MDVLTCRHTHAPVQEEGHGQQRVVCSFICSKLLEVVARRISMVLLHCAQVA